MLIIIFCLIDYLYVSDTRTRGIFEMRKRDGGGNIMIRQGITGIMNIKAYTADLHSSKFTHREASKFVNSLILLSPTVIYAKW